MKKPQSYRRNQIHYEKVSKEMLKSWIAYIKSKHKEDFPYYYKLVLVLVEERYKHKICGRIYLQTLGPNGYIFLDMLALFRKQSDARKTYFECIAEIGKSEVFKSKKDLALKFEVVI